MDRPARLFTSGREVCKNHLKGLFVTPITMVYIGPHISGSSQFSNILPDGSPYLLRVSCLGYELRLEVPHQDEYDHMDT